MADRFQLPMDRFCKVHHRGPCRASCLKNATPASLLSALPQAKHLQITIVEYMVALSFSERRIWLPMRCKCQRKVEMSGF